MSDLLDLCLTLALPPDGAPSGTIASLNLRCDVLGPIQANGLLTDPLPGRATGGASQESPTVRSTLNMFTKMADTGNIAHRLKRPFEK